MSSAATMSARSSSAMRRAEASAVLPIGVAADRASRNVGSAHESVKSRIAVCVFIFTFALVFAFALIHAFHAFSLSNAKENERPSTFCCPKNGRQFI